MSLERECESELGRDAGFANAAFAGEHERDVLDVLQRHRIVWSVCLESTVQETSMSIMTWEKLMMY
jgi:hypothetical protein